MKKDGGCVRSWLRSIRELKNMSEQKVADLVGISQPAYHMIESGQKNPSVSTAQGIARVLGFDWTIFYPEPYPGKQNEKGA